MATDTEDRPQAAETKRRNIRPRAAKPATAKSANAKSTAAKSAAGKAGAEKTNGAGVATRAKTAVTRRAKAVGDTVAAQKTAAARTAKSAARTVKRTARAPAGIAVAAGAAGLVAGIAANFVRKAIVQAPTALAGQWDEALKVEHQMTLAIFDKIEQTTEVNTSKRAALLTQLKHALAKHAMQEENIVYAALRDHQQKSEADKLNHEHGYVKQYLYDLTQIDRASPKWIATVREFHSMIVNHMREEENDVFPKMRAEMTEEENKALTLAMNKEGLKVA